MFVDFLTMFYYFWAILGARIVWGADMEVLRGLEHLQAPCGSRFGDDVALVLVPIRGP